MARPSTIGTSRKVTVKALRRLSRCTAVNSPAVNASASAHHGGASPGSSAPAWCGMAKAYKPAADEPMAKLSSATAIVGDSRAAHRGTSREPNTVLLH